MTFYVLAYTIICKPKIYTDNNDFTYYFAFSVIYFYAC